METGSTVLRTFYSEAVPSCQVVAGGTAGGWGSAIGGCREEADASDLPQAFIAKWLPVISETTFHFKAPDVVVFLLWVVSRCRGQICFL